MKRCVSLILFVGVLFFMSISICSAKILSVSEVFEYTKNSESYLFIKAFLKEFNQDIDITLDTQNQKIIINDGTKDIGAINYTENYFIYDNRNAIVNEESCKNDASTIVAMLVLNSIYELSGYKDVDITDDIISDLVKEDSFYEKYGLQLLTQKCSYKDSTGNTVEGDYMLFYKQSLDTEKADAFFKDFKAKEEEKSEDEIKILEVVPSLKVVEISNDKIKLKPSVSYTPIDPNFSAMCSIYRADSEDGTYEDVMGITVDCLSDIEITDEELQSNHTYYYKVKLTNGKYSDTLKVTTKSIDNTGIENPNTGFFAPVAGTLLLIIMASIIFVFNRKRTIFKRI